MDFEVHDSSGEAHSMKLVPYTIYEFLFDKTISGTDDDLPPSNQNRVFLRGSSIACNGRSAVGSLPHSRMHIDMEAQNQIHQLEREAYSSVLRAFKAQSDALTWEKESLITELRKELRVSDDEHRQILSRVNADEIIRNIREWRQTGSYQPPRRSTSQPLHDVMSTPTVSASRKKQKTSQSGHSLPGLTSVRSVQYASDGPARGRHFTNRSTSCNALESDADSLIGKKVWTRWPEDNHFYEAVITEYNPTDGRHSLVYDMNQAHETWEWVDLKQIPPEDIRWEGEDTGASYRSGHCMRHTGQGRGAKSFSHGSNTLGAGRGRGFQKVESGKEFFPLQNGIGKIVLDDVELINTDSLVKEVERVLAASHPDPLELEKAKKMLKEHEQALVDAVARLADESDGESAGEHPCLNGHFMEMG